MSREKIRRLYWAERYVPPKEEKDGTGSADTEEYISFGDRALAAMSGIFGVSEAKAGETEIDAVTSAAKPTVRNLLERTPSNGKDDYLLFDGFKLTWYHNDKPLKSWKAMSGRAEYQDKKYTSMKNVGPLPEGAWNVNQDRYQNYDDQGLENKILGFFKHGTWRGGKSIWGNHRIWLEPTKETDNLGRTNLSIHGGWTFGSAGCIDLADGMDDFAEMYRKYGKNMKLKVKYSPNFGK